MASRRYAWGRALPLLLCLALAACKGNAPAGRVRILCLGDSLTESRFGSYVRPLKRMLRQEFPGRALVSGAARPGDTSGEYLAFLEGSPLLEKEKPDFVLLMIGTNDVRIDADRTGLAAFTANLGRILGLLAAARGRGGESPTVVIATVPPIFRSDQYIFDDSSARRIAAEINPAVRCIAADRGLVLADVEAAFLRRPELLPGIHPAADGYREIAATFFRTLSPLLRKWRR